MKLLRITTVPISLRLLLTGQMRFMREHGFDVRMISADGPERALVIEAEDCPHEIVPFTRAITPVQDLQCLWRLIRLLRRERPDIVHTHTPKAGLLGMLAARLTGVPVRIHTVAGLPFMTAGGRKRQLLMLMERLTYWGAQHVWPNSPSMLAYMREIRLCPERKLGMISRGSTNGIDLGRFSPAAVPAATLERLRAEIGYDPDATYLLAVGRVVKDKGIPELVEAFANLHEQFPRLRLLLVGPLERERAEETLPAATLQAIESHPAIQHIGWSDEVPALLLLADTLVHASHREGFPNVPLQAGAMGLPIVCSAIPGNIDIVEHERTGLTFPVGDTAALRDVLERALSGEEEGQKMAAALRKEVEELYDRRVIHAALLEKYQALVG